MGLPTHNIGLVGPLSRAPVAQGSLRSRETSRQALLMENETTGATTTLPTAPAVVREQPSGESMRAIVRDGFGGLDRLVYTDIPKPLPRDGEVVIAVHGFGLNHA